MAGKSKSDSRKPKSVTNRKARRYYTVIDELEAGIELKGTEVKSIRAGQISLDEGFASIEGLEVWLNGVHINPYDHGNVNNHEPLRSRRLLLHRGEIKRLIGQVAQKGYTLVPMKLYFKNNRVKISIGLCKGKDSEDRREDLKRRTADRDADRAIAEHKRRG